MSVNNEDLYPLAALIDELRHEDVTLRVYAMSRITTIALALGEERTRGELIDYLTDMAQEDEDEILVMLAEKLAEFIPLVGGAAYAPVLLRPLETLASCEEPTVRDAAVQSISTIAASLSPQQIAQQLVPLIKRMCSTDWFSSRMSACGLVAPAIKSSMGTTVTRELIMIYSELVCNDAPMVRRAAATNLPAVIAAAAEKSHGAESLEADGNPSTEAIVADMFQALVTDDQDSVRLLSVDVVIELAKVGHSASKPLLVDRALDLLNDKSWRVRYQATDRFEALVNALQSPEDMPRFIECFVRLSKDPEAEVRSALPKQIVGFSKLLNHEQVMEHVVPNLELLAEDVSEQVRENLATYISYMAPILGRDETVSRLQPLFVMMLRDEHSEVRLQIISHLQVINEVIGIDQLSQSLLPAISDLAKDKQWRVSLAVIEHSPLLAEQLGVEFFNRELVSQVTGWLWDPVWAIRNAAAKNFVKLAEVFGVEWLETVILPHVVDYKPAANFLYRQTTLMATIILIPTLTPQTLIDVVLPFILAMSEDPVPNIRFSCAKALQALATALIEKAPDRKAVIHDTIIPILEKHIEDVDVDVRFYVDEALRNIRELNI